jgi:hypothetical protein
VGYAWTFARRVTFLNSTGDLDIGNSPASESFWKSPLLLGFGRGLP